jgi:ATP-binding cassette subfamily F protein 3
MQTEHLNLGYGDKILLKDIGFTIQSQDRIGLLGMNGAGKSTLIKALAGEIMPSKGEIINAPKLRIGYFSQQHLDTLRETESPLWHMLRIAPNESAQKLRGYLGGFNFGGDMVTSSIEHFSGGEKARLSLALLIWQKPHLLLLDEPTNHLDLDMRHALVMALQQFDGALIVVSHDRSLLASCVDEFWLVADQKVVPFDGDLEDYRAWCAKSWHLHKQNNHAAAAVDKAPAVKKATASEIFEQKNLKQKVAKLEKKLTTA